MKILYTANILGAGWIAPSSLSFQKTASATAFSGAHEKAKEIVVGTTFTISKT